MQATKIHRKFDKRSDAKKAGYIYNVSLPWQSQSSIFWNEACADVIEVFGLPGGKYMTHANMDYMDFGFKSEKDAALCKILLSEHLNS